MKKFAGLALVGVGAMVATTAAPSRAAFKTSISGNFQYTNMQYWCDNGTPNFSFSYRTLNKTEAKVTFTASGYRPLVTTDVKPYTSGGSIQSVTKVPGRSITVHAVGSTTGSSFNVSGTVPTSCAGLPTKQPVMDWGTAGQPTAQPVPTTTSPSPTTTSPKPTTSTTAPKPTSTTTSPMPTSSAPTSTAGPKVETDRVAPQSNNTAALAVGIGAFAIVAAGGTVAVRRGRK